MHCSSYRLLPSFVHFVAASMAPLCVGPVRPLLGHVGFEPDRNTANVGRHRHRAAYSAIRASAAAGGVEAVSQFHAEAHRAAVACRFHVLCFIRRHRPAPERRRRFPCDAFLAQSYHIEWGCCAAQQNLVGDERSGSTCPFRLCPRHVRSYPNHRQGWRGPSDRLVPTVKVPSRASVPAVAMIGHHFSMLEAGRRAGAVMFEKALKCAARHIGRRTRTWPAPTN